MPLIFRNDFRTLLVLVILSVTVGSQVKASFLGQSRLTPSKDTPRQFLSPAQARKLEESLGDLVEVSVDEDDVDSILVPRIRGVRQTPVEDPAPKVEQAREAHAHSNIHSPIPNLVRMLSTLNFTDADFLKTDSVRAGFNPIYDYNVFEPMYDNSLNYLEGFVNATVILAGLYEQIQALSVENVSIMKDLVAGTNTNYVGYYN